ncbi:MAG: hypothetical protein AAGG44_00985, partial [Planctomycetota bacterium]
MDNADDATCRGQDQILSQLRALRTTDCSTSLKEFVGWHAPRTLDEETVARLVAEDIRLLSNNGATPKVEGYLSDFPRLAGSPAAWQIVDAYDRNVSSRGLATGDESWRDALNTVRDEGANFAEAPPTPLNGEDVDLSRLKPGDRVLEFDVLQTL